MVVTLKELRDCGTPDEFLRQFEKDFGQEVTLTRRVLARMGNKMAYRITILPALKRYQKDYLQAVVSLWESIIISGHEGEDALALYREGCPNALADLMGLDRDGQDSPGEPQCRCATLLWGHESGCPFAKGRRQR